MKKIEEMDLNLVKSLGTASTGEFLAKNENARTAVSNEEETPENRERNLKLLLQGEGYYNSLSNFRRRRERARNYYYGKQWCDTITVSINGTKRTMSEYEYLSRQGKPPLKQNMIRPALKNLIGQYRSNPTKPLVFARNREDQEASEMMSSALDAVLFMNDSKERDTRELEEFLISGAAISRTSYRYSDARRCAIPQFESVPVNRFFYNTDSEDVLGKDVDFIGEILDLPMEELIKTYAHNYEEEKRLREIYKTVNPDNIRNIFGSSLLTAEHKIKNIDFYCSNDINTCRVIEIWRKEGEWRLFCHDYLDGSLTVRKKSDYNISLINEENKKREAMSNKIKKNIGPITIKEQYVRVWKCYHLSPTGDTIFESETPYAHGSHPFVFTFYPLVDGRAWGMVEDLIDQQKMINRNMVLFDFINSASAKGVLVVPEEAIPDDMSIEDIAEEWTKFNGVIKIKAKAGVPIPQQIITNSVHPGLNEMIQMQLKFMQDIGGVQDAAMGRNTGSTAPASLYAQQAQNSSINNLDYISTFNNFIQKRDLKLIQLIQQYFTNKEFIGTANNKTSKVAMYYDPEKIRNVDFDNSIGSSSDTPAFRALADNTLMQLLQMQSIDAETFLENSSLPYADKILESIRTKKSIQELEQQQAMAQQQAQEQNQQQVEQNGNEGTTETVA